VDPEAWRTATPPPDTLRWVVAAVGRGAQLVRVRLLPSAWAAVHAIDVDDADGRRHRLVLRRWARPGWEVDPEFTAGREAAVLDRLSRFSLPVPRLVAVDADATGCDVPALLMTRLPGQPPSVRSWSQPAFLGSLIDGLVAIHLLRDDLADAAPPFAPFYDLRAVKPPPGSARPDLWRRAVETVVDEPRTPRRFIHRDFHPGNTLWQGERLTGIVDWTSASIGPAAADLGHLLANLALKHGAPVARRARHAYAGRVGPPADERYWTIAMVLDVVPDLPRRELAAGGLERLEEYLATLLDGYAGP
jgi:aminoglycoside phosphotransferase (APT) family kinase protein